MSSVIRVESETREKLEVLKKKLGAKSMSQLLKIIVDVAEKELDKFKGNPKIFLKTLKFAGEAGTHDSEQVDKLLYGAKE
ncbi:MAG: hypothetical protein ACTSYM_10750 [Candidatus Baldrarchaeia archaeon]